MKNNSVPLISIIIPTKNEEKYIEQCLDAITRAEKADFKIEVIIVDNGSCDRTKEIASNYPVNFIEVNARSIAYQRNWGARKAKGEFLAFIDADCEINSNLFINSLKYFNGPLIAAVGARPGIPDKSTWVQKTWAYQRKENGVQQVRWLSSSNFIIRRNVFWEFNGFNENLITCEDYDLGVRIAGKYKLVSDENLRSIHLREPATIKEFFLKELWRGKSNIQSFLSHTFEWRELPSVIIPVIYLGLISSIPFFLYFSHYVMFFLCFLAFLAAPFFMIFRKNKFNLPVTTYGKLYFLANIYMLARACSIFVDIYEGIIEEDKR